jgi:hypothetical protein
MEFSYAGSGPADCAATVLALLLPLKEAWRLHQPFKRDIIARIARDGGVLEMADVRAWVVAWWAGEVEDAAPPR